MKGRRPTLIGLIGYGYVMNALLLIVTLFPKFIEQFGFISDPSPVFPAVLIRMLISIILLIIAYGYLKLKTWGYWLMIAYTSIKIMIIMFHLIVQHYYQGGALIYVLVLSYTLSYREYFGIKLNSSID